MLNQTERSAFEIFQDGSWKSGSDGGDAWQDEEGWIRLGLCFLLETVIILRNLRFEQMEGRWGLKPDGSPVSHIEGEIERLLSKRLARLTTSVAILGEEAGGTVNPDGFTVAIDPIDGTWAFLNRAETFSTTVTVLRDRNPVIGLMANPATGELAYSTATGRVRLIQLPLLGGFPSACNLPLPNSLGNNLLVNVHPARQMAPLLSQLGAAWMAGEIQLLKASGGSPAWSLLDVAKSGCTYVNLWAGEPAQPYDLAAGVMLVRGAGGIVVDVQGIPVDPIGHQGPFIAGLQHQAVERVAKFVAEAMESGSES